MTTTVKPARQLLIEAKALITDPANWCQGDFARNADGIDVGALDPTAVCRCSLGALGCAAGIDPNGSTPELAPAISLLDNAATKLSMPENDDGDHYASIVDLNDGVDCAPGMTSHQAVLAAFDMAIENAPA